MAAPVLQRIPVVAGLAYIERVRRLPGSFAATLVIERTPDPDSWAIVTGWTASPRERKVLSR